MRAAAAGADRLVEYHTRSRRERAMLHIYGDDIIYRNILFSTLREHEFFV